eukprot:CAMPEP_0168235920 /NCGR_PEP_ID=MMETSP0140_2-20121125/19199_1 /TAXON_ID=44445 /ORGANISM="Pseudo-nitzschia australis, Strain 10249 10 AB" /LENGTH=621 /DNA_ID=CAMNT_0008169097 /DNA_START=95 /DNA_END=1960 /DNA_ORIENTATION=+
MVRSKRKVDRSTTGTSTGSTSTRTLSTNNNDGRTRTQTRRPIQTTSHANPNANYAAKSTATATTITNTSIRRDSKKQLKTSAVRGGQIYEKASSRRIRTRAALDQSGHSELAVPLGSRNRSRQLTQQQQQQQNSSNSSNNFGFKQQRRLSHNALPEVQDLEHRLAQSSFLRVARIREGMKRQRMRQQEQEQERVLVRKHASVAATMKKHEHQKKKKKLHDNNNNNDRNRMMLPSNNPVGSQRRVSKSKSRSAPQTIQRQRSQNNSESQTQLQQLSLVQRKQNQHHVNSQVAVSITNTNSIKKKNSISRLTSPRTANAFNDQIFAASVSARVNELLISDRDSDSESDNIIFHDEEEYNLVGCKNNDKINTIDSGCMIVNGNSNSNSNNEQSKGKGKSISGHNKGKGKSINSSSNSKSDQFFFRKSKTASTTRDTTTELKESYLARGAAPAFPAKMKTEEPMVIDLSHEEDDDIAIKIEPETYSPKQPIWSSWSLPSSSRNSISNTAVQTMTQLLLDEAIGRGADFHEMEKYAKELIKLGLHSKEMILDALLNEHYVPNLEQEVGKWSWMKDYHKNVFQSWVLSFSSKNQERQHQHQQQASQNGNGMLLDQTASLYRGGSFDL